MQVDEQGVDRVVSFFSKKFNRYQLLSGGKINSCFDLGLAAFCRLCWVWNDTGGGVYGSQPTYLSLHPAMPQPKAD